MEEIRKWESYSSLKSKHPIGYPKKKKNSFAVRLRMKKEKWQLKKKKVEPSLKSNGMLRNF